MVKTFALNPNAKRILLVTGMSGAGKSTALRALEDIGYEVVDNLPLSLMRRLIAVHESGDGETPDPRPLAVGIDTRTRAFDAEDVVQTIKRMTKTGIDVRVLFIDCSGSELTRRFSETRRRHPLALDRPATDGIAREREVLSPLRRWADIVIDTTDYGPHDLRREIRDKFTHPHNAALTLTLMSFGFARGIPRDADLVFDMRFLANPHWQEQLRPLTGRDQPVGDFIAADPAFSPAFERIIDLILTLLPGYLNEGKSYLTIAFGCTGGKHRSVYTTECAATRLKAEGYAATIVHRDMKGHSDGSLDDSTAGVIAKGAKSNA